MPSLLIKRRTSSRFMLDETPLSAPHVRVPLLRAVSSTSLIQRTELVGVRPALRIDPREGEVYLPPAVGHALREDRVEEIVAQDAGVGAQHQPRFLPRARQRVPPLVLEDLLHVRVLLAVALLDLCCCFFLRSCFLTAQPVASPTIEAALQLLRVI